MAKQLHVSKVTKAKIKWQGRPELREQLGRCGSLQSVSLLLLSAAGSGVCVLFGVGSGPSLGLDSTCAFKLFAFFLLPPVSSLAPN